MQVTALDHLVLTVRDLAATCEFYARVLGMRVTTFAAGRLRSIYCRHPDGNLIEVANQLGNHAG